MPGKRRRATLSFLFILCLVLTVSLGLLFLGRGGEISNYRVVRVKRGSITATISATGTLRPLTTVLVGSQVSGRIQAIYVDYNSRVKKGQLIAQIDPAPFQAQLVQAKANLDNALANLEVAKVRLKDRERTLRRYKRLYQERVISQDELDTVLTNYELALAQLKSAQAQVSQARANLELAETNLHYTRIISPVDGIVISREVDVGQTVAARFQTPVLFKIAEDLTKMRLEANVDEADIGQIRVGQRAVFYVDAYPDTPFEAKVSQIRNNPQIIQNVVTYDVIMEVNNADLRLKPGMTATVSIIIAHKEDVLKVPNSAFRFHPSRESEDERWGPLYSSHRQEKGARWLWIIDLQGAPLPVRVIPGITDGIYTEILKGPLQEGQEVIIGEAKKGATRRGGEGRPGRLRFF